MKAERSPQPSSAEPRRSVLGRVVTRRGFFRTAAEVGATVYVGGQVGTVLATEHGVVPQALGRDIGHLTTPEPVREALNAGTKAYEGWNKAATAVETAAASTTHLVEKVIKPADVKLEDFQNWWKGLPDIEKKLLTPVAWVSEFLEAIVNGVEEVADGLDSAAKGNREELNKFEEGQNFPGAMRIVYGDDPLPGETPQNK